MATEHAPVHLQAKWWWTIVAGLIFAAAALVAVPLAGLDLGALGAEQQGQLTWPTLFVGSFLTGCFFWWLVVARSQHLSARRGAVTGVLVGLFSYPVVLALAELLRRGGSALGSPGERVVNILELAAFTILTTGFGATLAMALVGSLAALALRRAYPSRPAPWRGTLARRLLKAVTAITLVLVALLSGIFIWLSLLPLDAAGLARSRITSAPATTYAEAIAAFGAVRAREAGLPLNPRCASLLLTHGARVAKAVVFFHGFTNCPAQFDELAPELFALGYNVYVPLVPRHGEADQMTLALAGLTAEEIVAAADEAIDLAQGLGNDVVVAGLSGGGTMAAWSGQYRADADNTIAIAPFFGPHVVPFWANRAATNLLLLLPNLMVPWNPREPEGPPAMDYAYPRYATHALAQFMRLGEILAASARIDPPLAPGLGMLLNDADVAVSNALARRVIASWEGHGRKVDVEVLPQSLRLIHDLIDPRQEEANTSLVYPILIDMIQRPPPHEAPE